jgi:hypothetical protein
VLQWLRANGCPWDEETCSTAARGGQLEVLQWLRANGCPWDEKTCARAVDIRHLEMLKWARANGAPWDKADIMREAPRDAKMGAREWRTVG